ncbi:MAG: 50S ribosomal protein L29 [Chloroflexota bacterium]|nr:50S ribosomal protein L29 [Chloroflexota bacterium]MDE2942398.1 50S ribosomal protein L29 [Chloroflexota bacterium]MDE3267922.1 50S ribosomal protein L29 [Chloroflexota bacterium]
MDIAAIRTLTDDQLYTELDGAYREMMNVRFRLSTRQLNNPQELRNARKTIAQLKTVMRQRGIREK